MAKDNSQTQQETTVLAPVVEKYVFCRPLQGEQAKRVYDEVRARVVKDFKDVPAFSTYFEFNKETGQISGLSVPYGILVNQALEEEGFWLPTIAEARQMHDLGKFTNGVYRDFGMAIYSNTSPNQAVADRILKQAQRKGWQVPILVSFKDLKIRKGKNLSGVNISVKDSQGFMTGEEADQYLGEKFNYKADSGARRVDRYNGGDWDANWNDLGISNSYGRVDWLCGEATAKNLEKVVVADFNQVAEAKAKELNDKIARAKSSAVAILNS